MFSHRVPADHTINRLSRALEERKARGERILDLTESNPTQCGLLYDEQGIARALGRPGSLLYEPHPQGLEDARRAVAEYYRQKGFGVEPDSLFLTTGTSEAYGHLFKLLADPGDEILVPVPGYPLLEVLSSLEAVHLVPYATCYDESRGWFIDIERLRATISTRTVAIALVSPNNPTGSFLKKSELAEIGVLCRDFGLALVVDEVFSDYGADATPPMQQVRSAVEHAEALTFVLSGLSKILGLPQMKLGWIHLNGPERLCRDARERLAFVTDAFLSVSTPVQHAAVDLLALRPQIQAQILARLEENGRTLAQGLADVSSCRTLAREGGWYAVLRLADGVSDEEVALQLLEEDGVHVHPGYFYDFPTGTHLVLSLLTSSEAFREGVARIAMRLRDSGS